MTDQFPLVRPPDQDETPLSPTEQIVAMRDHPLIEFAAPRQPSEVA